jgi:hypothetical protein
MFNNFDANIRIMVNRRANYLDAITIYDIGREINLLNIGLFQRVGFKKINDRKIT